MYAMAPAMRPIAKKIAIRNHLPPPPPGPRPSGDLICRNFLLLHVQLFAALAAGDFSCAHGPNLVCWSALDTAMAVLARLQPALGRVHHVMTLSRQRVKPRRGRLRRR